MNAEFVSQVDFWDGLNPASLCVLQTSRRCCCFGREFLFTSSRTFWMITHSVIKSRAFFWWVWQLPPVLVSARVTFLIPSCRLPIWFCQNHLHHFLPLGKGKGVGYSWVGWEVFLQMGGICNTLPLFVKTFTQIFQVVPPGREVAKASVSLCQGRISVLDYAIEFRTLVANSWRNQPAWLRIN